MAAFAQMQQAEPSIMRELREERDKVRKYRRWFRDSWEAFEDWRNKAVESQQFVANRQWSEDDLQRLARDRRPALTINHILSTVLFLTGLQRQQRQEVKLLPFEASDVKPAELMNGLLKFVSSQSREAVIDSAVFKDTVITGLGWWKVFLDFEETPEGQLRWARLNPLAVWPDPNFLEGGWESARFVFEGYWMPIGEAMDRWPDHADDIRTRFGDWIHRGAGSANEPLWTGSQGDETSGDAFAPKRFFWDQETQRVRILTCWSSDRVHVPVILNKETGDVLVDEDEKFIRRIAQNIEKSPILQQRYAKVMRPVKKVTVAHMLDEILLEEMPSPYQSTKFPIFPSVGHYFYEVPYGTVEYQKDPQRSTNKHRTTMTELTMRMPHSGFYNKSTGGSKTRELEEYASGNGVVINYEETPPEMIRPPEIPQTLVMLERAASTEIERIVNVNAELLGQTTQRTVSGRALEARQRSGLVVQEPLLEGFMQAKEEPVRFLVDIIPQFMSIATARRLLGTLAEREPQDPAAQLMRNEPPDALEQLLSGAFDAKFDVVVKSQPFEPSLQVQKWQILLELFQLKPDAIPVPLMAKAAKNAGLLNDEEAQEILIHVQQMGGPMPAPGQEQGQATRYSQPALPAGVTPQ